MKTFPFIMTSLSVDLDATKLLRDPPTDEYLKVCEVLSNELREFSSYLPLGEASTSSQVWDALESALVECRTGDVGYLDRYMTRLLRSIEPTSTKVGRADVLDALCTYLQAAKLLARQASEESLEMELMDADIGELEAMDSEDASTLQSSIKKQVESMMHALSMHATSRKHAAQVVRTATCQTRELSKVDGMNLFDAVLSSDQLNPSQMETLESLQDTFRAEYRARREMLIKRVGVTLQSFTRSSRIEQNQEEVDAIISEAMKGMETDPDVSLQEIFHLTHFDLVSMRQKTSFGKGKSFTSSVKNVLMGSVPDRGGRPGDRRITRMPSFKPREEDTDGPRKRQGGWRHHKKNKSVRG